MNTINKSSIKITTLIIIFPLTVLLLYGILSHIFFFFSRNTETQQEIIKYEKKAIDTEKNNLKDRVENLVQFVEYLDRNMLIRINKKIVDKKMVFYPLNSMQESINNYQKEGFSQNKRYISYTKYLPKYNCYLTVNKRLTDIQSDIKDKKITNDIKENINTKTNLKILLFTWVISIMLSLYLSMTINRMLRSYEKKLQNANEKLVFQSRQALIGELFSMIAHQWRQPINKIASILALLRFKIPQKDISYREIDKKCLQIEESIEFMSETIDDFRTFYQPKNRRENIDLTRLVKKSINFIEGHIRKKDIEVITLLEQIEIDIYANEFLQVMINIIKNAVDSVSRQGKIIIKLYRYGDSIIISVEDNGEGIDKEIISKVFDPYYTTKKNSMGLGLYMTKIIVEKHMNGVIEVERLPKGSLFKISIKATPPLELEALTQC